MRKFAAALGFAGLLAVGGVSTASADVASMMQCTAACNTSWGQCLTSSTDTMIASTPQEGMNKMQQNSANAASCAQQAQACYSSCS